MSNLQSLLAMLNSRVVLSTYCLVLIERGLGEGKLRSGLSNNYKRTRRNVTLKCICNNYVTQFGDREEANHNPM